ncbi:MAG TPA: beta-ketoacyl-ACP synthase III [Methylomusa anaerophila]|uniref:Beta-ketoacyl-[acyl-carrier-protein] synthase III n=1 Tax=Methylomusa anaerophila TaxID=1930071 RepID=A0A348AM07_9FIRM|nr:beta-ketoacyl-ACP synthase III [Methylomusa anaerophila]BBB92105.1 3-oxoacyl-[acyl-carrier-protein] synthase 3 [Methylomusa anaerophila]HML87880.1 beta-ketoacyl-ACP synthase III [Methylomusa anaerophila]
MNKKSVGILGIGSYVPAKVVTNKDIEKMVDTSDEWIVERTGIRERHIAAAGEATSDLAAIAAQRALEDAGVGAGEIELILVATATPDMYFPATACLVQSSLKAVNAAAFDLSAVCSGFVYGLVTGSQFIMAGTYRKVLVIGAETFSRITDWTDRSTCAIFGDGAGAVVLGETSPGCGVLGIHLGADGAGGDLLKVPAGGSRQPASAETISQRLHFVHMNGNEVYKFAVKIMGEAANRALENANLSPADITYLVPHQANIRICQAAAKRLGLPMEKVLVNIDKYGNTSAASIPIVLDEALKSGRVKNGDILVLVGFGGGLTWAASVVKWCKG